MRFIGTLSLTLSAALVLFGCGTNTTSSPESKAKATIAKDKIGEAAEATADAARAKRDEYARAMSKRLGELNAKYEELKDRAAKADAKTKKDLEKKLEDARVKRDVAATKLEELKTAGADRWEKIKDGVGNAFDDLKKAFE